MKPKLAVVETHPVQYHAPVYREVERGSCVPVTAVYGSDFSVRGYRDAEFGSTFCWDTDLLSGYTACFLSRAADGGAVAAEAVSARGLGRVLDEIRPTAVLLTGYASAFHWQAFHEARKRRVPLLLRAETNDDARDRHWVKAAARDIFLRWFYGRCSRLLYIGKKSRQHYRRLNVEERKMFFAPYCVDTAAFRCTEKDRAVLRPAARAELGIGEARKTVLFAGKLSPRKGVDLLIEAAKKLPEETRLGLTVLFLGDGSSRAALEAAAATEPRVDARFIGFKNQSQLSPYYHAADALVLPSRHSETWGLVVNEALHHGLPCVVSDRVGCADDLVESGSTGETFASGSAAALAAALLKGLKLSGDASARERCRQKIADYTVEKAAQGIVEALKSLEAAP